MHNAIVLNGVAEVDAASTLHHSLLPIFVLPSPLSASYVRGRLFCSNQAFAFTPPLVHSRMLLLSFIHIFFFTVSTAAQSPPQISPALLTHRLPTPAAYICIPLAFHPLSLFFNLFLRALLTFSLPLFCILSFLLPCLHLIALSPPLQSLLLVFFIPSAFRACFLSVFLLAQICN